MSTSGRVGEGGTGQCRIKKNFRNMIKSWTEVNERIVKVEMMYKRRMCILGVYAPNEDAITTVKDLFYEPMKGVLDEEITILGDLMHALVKAMQVTLL